MLLAGSSKPCRHYRLRGYVWSRIRRCLDCRHGGVRIHAQQSPKHWHVHRHGVWSGGYRNFDRASRRWCADSKVSWVCASVDSQRCFLSCWSCLRFSGEVDQGNRNAGEGMNTGEAESTACVDSSYHIIMDWNTVQTVKPLVKSSSYRSRSL